MNEGVSTVTRKGQVTVPVEIRRALGIQQGDKVAFVLENGQVKFSRQRSYTERTKGAMTTNRPRLTAEQLREAAEQAFVDEVTERTRG
jgi:antitoxin PrlF